MKAKRLIAMMTATVMFGSLFTACGQPSEESVSKTENSESSEATVSEDKYADADPFYKYPETITIQIPREISTDTSFPEGDSISNNDITRAIAEEFNIEFSSAWESALGTDSDTKINLAIASNNIPDMMVVNEAQFRALLNADMLQPLTESYEAFKSDTLANMTDSYNGLAIEGVTVDGEMMAIPSLNPPDNGYGIVWIRKDWIDALGMEEPKTLEDVQEIARAFMTKDPAGNGAGKTIGISAPASGGKLYGDFLLPKPDLGSFDPFFTAMDAYPGFWIEKDGETVYGSIQPETKEALAVLADMYEEGLFNPQMGVSDSATEEAIAGTSGIICAPWWSGYNFVWQTLQVNPEANWQAYVLQGEDGSYNSKATPVTAQYLVVSKNCEYPEAATILTNYAIVAEPTWDLERVSINDFPLRLPVAPADECAFEVEAMRSILAGESTVEEYSVEEYAPYKLLAGDAAAAVKTFIDPTAGFDMSNWDIEASTSDVPRLLSILLGSGAIVDHDINRVFSKTYTATETMNSKWTTLDTMEDTLFMNIIMGNASIDEFDAFVEEWKKLGGDEITAEVDALK